MTIEQFNNAITTYCCQINATELGNRLIATINGKNILYTQVNRDADFKAAKDLGISCTAKGWLFAEVGDIPSQFEHEKWETPIIAKVKEGEIPPSAVKDQKNLVLYNSTFLAYSYAKPNSEQEIGYLSKDEDGKWSGFGESQRQEFMQYLISMQIIPI